MIVPGVGCDWIVSEHAAFKESCRSNQMSPKKDTLA